VNQQKNPNIPARLRRLRSGIAAVGREKKRSKDHLVGPGEPSDYKWWQLKYFLEFSPLFLGKIPILANIFQMG